MIKRCRLGSVYTKSPAQLVHRWCVENGFRLISSIICSIIWLGVLYVLVGIINFLNANMSGFWSESLTVSDIYGHVFMLPVKIVGMIFVFIYVFKNKPNRI